MDPGSRTPSSPPSPSGEKGLTQTSASRGEEGANCFEETVPGAEPVDMKSTTSHFISKVVQLPFLRSPDSEKMGDSDQRVIGRQMTQQLPGWCRNLKSMGTKCANIAIGVVHGMRKTIP